MFIDKKFIHSLVDKYGKQTVYTEDRTWYNEHYLHSSIDKSLIKLVNQLFKIEMYCL
jgi:hypothetical protein